MSDLFAAAADSGGGPLADRMRPRSLDEIVGQEHIVAPGRLLRRSIQADRLSSILLYGPPGTGKTSLARVIANTTKSHFESLNAVLCGVKDVRDAIARAEERRRLYGKRTILFVDEVHRWNKAQQDALLPWVENGTVILVGATTENPFFEVNRALVSRSRIFQLTPLSQADLLKAAQAALRDRERGYGRWKIRFEDGALEHLVDIANGDARSLLNALELAIETSPDRWPPEDGAEIQVSMQAAEESIQRKAVLYDRDGDYHFDTISAFIKSLRGSDPDAALYWMAKMLRAGEDPDFIFRRMLISAGEDVGLADPNAIVVVQACAAAFARIGLPEGYYQLTEAALYLATAPKSNSALAFFDALKEVERENAEVPNHLKDASRDGEGFGHGDGYLYPHAYRDHWVAQQYLPGALTGRAFYIPTAVGYEGRIRDEVLKKREVQAAILFSEELESAESLSYSASARGRDGWYKRLESGRSRVLLADRAALFDSVALVRHSRILVAGADDGLLLWEASRRCPEGLAAGVVRNAEAKNSLERYAAALGEEERPLLAALDELLPETAQARELFTTDSFDAILAREPFRRAAAEQSFAQAFASFALAARALVAAEGTVALLQSPPSRGQRLAALLGRSSLAEPVDAAFLDRVAQAEESFFAAGPLAWGAKELVAAFDSAGFNCTAAELEREEERAIGERELSAWFNAEQSSWGKAILEKLGAEDFQLLESLVRKLCSTGTVSWRWTSLLLVARPR